MSSNKLGLPFEYKKIPEYFDVLNPDKGKDVEIKNSFIESCLKKYSVKTVLDLTCGTGSQVFFLAKIGYQCLGADFSPALIKIAKKKARAEKTTAKFINGDMRTLHVREFDAVITIHNAIGHLTKSDFIKTIKNIYRNLKAGGIYVFDILNLQAMSDKTVANLSYQTEERGKDYNFYHSQCSVVNKSTGRLTSYDMTMFQNKAEKPVQFTNKYSLQIYKAKELTQILQKCGFEVMELHSMDGRKFIANKTISMLIVCRKNL